METPSQQQKTRVEYFEDLLNRPAPELPPDISSADTDLPINCDRASKAEIKRAIGILKNGKAAGPDYIPAEAIKADTETAVNMLHDLFNKIWKDEIIPVEWKEGILIKLPKREI